MGDMGRAGLGVGLAVAALLLGGCGGDASPSALAPTTGSTLPATSPPPRFGAGSGIGSEASYGPQFPLTLRRTGGIAGFDDSIVLDATGRLRVETRSVHGRVCSLEPSVRSQLLSLLATLRLSADTTTTTDLPTEQLTPVDGADSNPITISVTDDRARAIDLSDPSLGEVSGLVATLVGDVTLSVPAVTRCTTPASPSATAAP